MCNSIFKYYDILHKNQNSQLRLNFFQFYFYLKDQSDYFLIKI